MNLNYILPGLLFISLIAASQTGKAQDTITMNNGEKMGGSIVTVGSKEIELSQTGKDSGITYIGISDIFTIKYRNGTIDTTGIVQPKADTIQNWRFKGIEDADANYKDKMPGSAVLATAFFATPIIGFFPAFICARTPPSIKHLNISDNTLLNNAEYMKGYKDEAYDIKNRKMWKNYIAGSVVSIVAVCFFLLH